MGEKTGVIAVCPLMIDVWQQKRKKFSWVWGSLLTSRTVQLTGHVAAYAFEFTGEGGGGTSGGKSSW